MSVPDGGSAEPRTGSASRAAEPSGGRSGGHRVPYGRALSVGLLLSAAAHLLAFEVFPAIQAPEYEGVVSQFEAVPVRSPVRVPPRPEPIREPSVPEVPSPEFAVDANVDVPDLGAPPEVPPVPPPPSVKFQEWEKPSYIPHEVAPEPEKKEITQERLREYYPDALAESGVEGIVELWVFVDGEGQVTRTRVIESSGHERLDRAARKVARQRSYLPAMNRDVPIGVWVTQRVCFVLLEEGEELPEDPKCNALLRDAG